MDFLLLACLAIFLSLVMAAAFAVQRMTGASGWIDTIWSAGVGVAGVFAAILADGPLWRGIAVLALVIAWSFRLASHIGTRTSSGSEDPRYARLLEEWGENGQARLFGFLQVQAVAAFVLVLSIYLAADTTEFPRLIDIIALLTGVVAVVGEAVADAQLSAFRKTPQAKTGVCEIGLWRYSRHPNYFFEWLFWCSFPLFALSSQPVSWLSLGAPVMMYWLLVHVSGIPPLEDHMLRSRGTRFRDLQTRVNAFFPGPRKTGGRP